MSHSLSNSTNTRVLPEFKNGSLEISPSPENHRFLSEEKKEQNEQREYTFFNCSNCTAGLVVAVGTILAAVSVYISAFLSKTTSVQVMKSDVDKITPLNNTFYNVKNSIYPPKTINQDYLNTFTSILKSMQPCNIHSSQLLYLIYGESGIGKTTMLKQALRSLEPFPYVVLNLERGNTWKYIGIKLNITTNNEIFTETFI